jgi:hypothetical protein
MILLLVLLIYVPILVANSFDIANGFNYLMDTFLLGGSALPLAGVLRVDSPLGPPVP